MEEIIIKHRYTDEVLLCGKYESIKDCLEKNRGANLVGANLEGANLVGANLEGANLVGANLVGANLGGAYLGGANLGGANLEGANLEGANLVGANLGGANLGGANLGGAYLGGAYLGGANLGGAKNYLNSHDFWIEIIRRQKVETFTEKEWAIIGVLFAYRLCWDSIKKRFGSKIMPIFKKLTKVGFNEGEAYYKELLRNSPREEG